eukprot:3169354-Pleurochrysis_carterae.AAC.4
MGGGGECETAEMAFEGTYVKEVWLTVERPLLRVLSGVGQDLQDEPEREAVAQVSMQLRVEAVQVAVAWPSRVQKASTLLSSLDAAAPDRLRSLVPLLPSLRYLQESPTNPSIALAALGQARVYCHQVADDFNRRPRAMP